MMSVFFIMYHSYGTLLYSEQFVNKELPHASIPYCKRLCTEEK